MMTISASFAAMLYLLLTIGALTAAWVYEHFRSKKKKLIHSFKELYLCEYCHFVYLEDPLKKVQRCPECKSLNKNNKL